MKPVTVRLNDRQIDLINQLDELYGDNTSEKIRTIVAMFLGGAVRWKPGQVSIPDPREVH